MTFLRCLEVPSKELFLQLKLFRKYKMYLNRFDNQFF